MSHGRVRGMKRRNVHCSKFRWPLKRNCITELIYSSTFPYPKFLVVWTLALLADFVLKFRFVYMGPFCLFINSVYTSFRNQGFAFSAFFVCAASTSSILFLLFIPTDWLDFAASMCVWAQYVWHTERGVCLSTVSLWIFFVCIEGAIDIRCKDLKNFHVDLCGIFAAHCIGYLVVTLAFDVSCRMHLRKQRGAEGEQVLSTGSAASAACRAADAEKAREEAAEGLFNMGSSILLQHNGGNTENLVKEDSRSALSENYKNVSGVVNSSPCSHSETNGNMPSSSTKNEKDKKCASKNLSTPKDLMENGIPDNQLSKPDALVKFEQDIKKVKADLQASRQMEQKLRHQISSLTNREKRIWTKVGQLQQENELLQNKLHNAVQMKQKDKEMISQLEKKIKAEQEERAFVKLQLMEEKKRKKLEEATAARAVLFAAATREECTETLRNHIQELETECKKLKNSINLKEDHIHELEMEVQELQKYKANEKDKEVLMSAFLAMQDKTQYLNNTLSAETRIKLDLFSALGHTKRQLETAKGQIIQKDEEIKDLNQKIARVMAVTPSITYTAATSTLSPACPHYCNKLVCNSPSGLYSNPSVYQLLKK